MKKFRKWKDVLIEDLKKDPEHLKAYLETALEGYEEDGDMGVLLGMIRHVSEAQGGLTQLAQKTGLTRQSLYKALSEAGNPRFKTLDLILRELGFCISFKPLKLQKKPRPSTKKKSSPAKKTKPTSAKKKSKKSAKPVTRAA